MEDRETILLVQRRFHTNQYPVVKSFLKEGHDVRFLAQDRHRQEVYDALEPDLVRLSTVSRLFHWLAGSVLPEDLRYTLAIPSLGWYWRYLRSVDPDLVIVKQYVALSFVTILFTRLQGIDLIFYDQEPVYGRGNRYTKRRIATAVYYLLHGERFVRISPVLGEEGGEPVIPRSYYVPFVADPDVDVGDRDYLESNNVRVISVGKLHHERKGHVLLLRAIHVLSEHYDLELTLVGSLGDPKDDYYQSVLEFIESHDLEEVVDIRANLSYHQVQEEYRRHDLFVLPSRDEPAAVSPLEAMNNGLPVICSDSNGTACYVHEGENGYVFRTDDMQDLIARIEAIIASEDVVREFGAQSIELTGSVYSQDRYYESLCDIVQEHF